MKKYEIYRLIMSEVDTANSLHDIQERSGFKVLEIELFEAITSPFFKKINKERLTDRQYNKLQKMILNSNRFIKPKNKSKHSKDIETYFKKNY